jgi:hypothetical protein
MTFKRFWAILLVIVPIALQALDALERQPPK